VGLNGNAPRWMLQYVIEYERVCSLPAVPFGLQHQGASLSSLGGALLGKGKVVGGGYYHLEFVGIDEHLVEGRAGGLWRYAYPIEAARQAVRARGLEPYREPMPFQSRAERREVVHQRFAARDYHVAAAGVGGAGCYVSHVAGRGVRGVPGCLAVAEWTAHVAARQPYEVCGASGIAAFALYRVKFFRHG